MAQMPETIILRKTGETKTEVTYCAADVKTNADRIRAMSDEELAFYIVNHPMWSDESACISWLKECAE